jgi:aspartate/glutamate racemase
LAGSNADFLVITSNAPHIVLDEIERAAGCQVLSMIQTTLEEVGRRGWNKVGVLGFGDPKAPVYTEPLGQLDLAYETIDEGPQARLNEAVVQLWEGRETTDSTRAVRDAVAALRAKGVDGIIWVAPNCPCCSKTTRMNRT